MISVSKARLAGLISLRTFGQGLLASAVIYALLLGWLAMSASHTSERLEARLASQTVLVENNITGSHTEPPSQTDHPGDNTADTGAHMPAGGHALAAAPIEGLYEKSPTGSLPSIRDRDGLTPFNAYKHPFDAAAAGNKPVIALAIVGLGLSEKASESAIRNMPDEVSFAFSPYTTALDFWVEQARSRGHEVWLTMPLESEGYPLDDPGPHTMLVSAPQRQNYEKLLWLMGRTLGYVGFIGNEDAVFLKSANDMRPILGAIYTRGLAFVDSTSAPSVVPQTMAMGQRAPYASIDVNIDREASPEAISAAFNALEQQARNTGMATAIIHPLPLSYQEVLKWLNSLHDKGFVLAPLSAAASRGR